MELETKGQIEEAARLFAVSWDGSSDDLERCIAAPYVARHQKKGSRPWLKWARYASSLAGWIAPNPYAALASCDDPNRVS